MTVERVKRVRMVVAGVLAAGSLGLSACVGVEQEFEEPQGNDAAGEAVVSEMPAVGENAEEMVVEEEPAEGVEGLTEGALGNLTYTVNGMDVPLVDGSYQEKPMPDSATFIANYTLGPWQAFGDLDGDGADDAVVVLIDAPGGSGVFTYLAAVVDQDGAPVNVATVSLGDRPQLDTVTIEEGRVVVTGKTHGEDDPMCCPSQEFRWSYALEDGELVGGAEDDSAAMEGSEGSEAAGAPPAALTVASGAWDGTECLWAGEGATLAFDGQRVGYTCTTTEEGEVVLLGEPVEGADGSWTIDLGVLVRNAADDGFELGEVEMVVVMPVE